MSCAAERRRLYAADGLRLAAVVVTYYVAAKIGLEQQLVRGQVTPFWPPTGIALVSLMLWGPRMWPGIALGAFLVNVMLGPGIVPVLAITVGNTLAPVCAYLLLRRAGFRLTLDRLQDALALVFLGALGGMLISATIGAGVLLASDAVSAHDFWPTWSVWWTGDAMGVLIIAPLLLAARTVRWPRGVPVLRWAEAVALLGGTAAVTALATDTSLQLLFLVVPFLIWAAFRFQLVGAAPCALIASVIAVYAGAVESGPFSGRDLLAMMIILQAFNGTVALTALLLSAVVTERNHTLEEIEKVCDHLKGALSRLALEEKRDGTPGAWAPSRPKEPDHRGRRRA
ncbi:MASE1 domain-containing protein [Actinomadura madurae]|uniref:MASE1 domain-containing protein n=1 Tax=Actinomadura madurae TaxID=1993 RepID=UPI000D9CA1D3|nr:MASE1 domain-containing protein [Actinomadura madurae]SPT51462.1 putative diguanylate cyclase [Actinomadura madurae]